MGAQGPLCEVEGSFDFAPILGGPGRARPVMGAGSWGTVRT